MEVMIDLETMGASPNGAIASIGAVTWDLSDNFSNTFYMTIDLTSNHSTASFNPSTIIFWMQQDDEARLELLESNVPLPYALTQFAKWLPTKPKIWGNGIAFDNVILRTAYDNFNIPCPWHFRDDRDVRTLVALGKNLGVKYESEDKSRDGVKHNALDDAIYQAKYCSHIIKQLKKNTVL